MFFFEITQLDLPRIIFLISSKLFRLSETKSIFETENLVDIILYVGDFGPQIQLTTEWSGSAGFNFKIILTYFLKS